MTDSQSQVYILKCFVNPFEAKPSFLIPLFQRKNEYYVQEIDSNNKVVQFHKVSTSSFSARHRNNRLVHLKEGDSAIFAFIFNDGAVEFETQTGLMPILSKRLPEISKHPYTFLEVAKFLGNNEERLNGITRLRNTLSYRNLEIANKLATIEMNDISQEGGKPLFTKVDVNILKHVDDDGFLSYWNLLSEVENLVNIYGKVYIRLKLARSFIGLSKNLKNVLMSFGFKSQKIGAESCEFPIDTYNISGLKQIQNYTVVLGARVLAEREILIGVCDELKIRKKYLKKDVRRIVKSKTGKDYFCEITDNLPLHSNINFEKE